MATITSESKYKSFMKPVKFWQKSSTQQKESTIDDLVNKDYNSQHGIAATEEQETPQKQLSKSSYLPSFSFGKKASSARPVPVVALTESGKAEVYKLSTIDDTGLYMPPSPSLQGKRDHWIEVTEDDMMDFHLPSSECLTTHVGEKHDFFTPSTLVQCQPYILPIADMSDSTLSAVPSLDDGNSDLTSPSCRSSASY
jgi:hypothetical protein